MGVSQAVLRGTPRPVAGTPQRRGASRDGGPPSRSPLFTLSFRCCPGASITLSVRPPACPPRPPVSCPRVCVWSSPLPTLPRAPPHPALASFGASGLCFRQELAAASRWPELGVGSSAAGGAAVRAGPPTGQCGAQPAAGTPRGLHRCLWGQPFRLEAQMQAWEVGWLGPHGGEWRGPRGPWLPSRWSCGAAWLGGPGLLDGAHTLGCLEQRVAGCCGG